MSLISARKRKRNRIKRMAIKRRYRAASNWAEIRTHLVSISGPTSASCATDRAQIPRQEERVIIARIAQRREWRLQLQNTASAAVALPACAAISRCIARSKGLLARKYAWYRVNLKYRHIPRVACHRQSGLSVCLRKAWYVLHYKRLRKRFFGVIVALA